MNRGEMRAKVISRLQEEASPRQWTRTEINEYLDEGQEAFNKKAWQIRLEIAYTVGLYGNVFPVPGDVLEIIGAHFWDGSEDTPLDPITRAELDRTQGTGWQDDTASEPDNYYEALIQDPPYLGIRDYISLYPIPTTDAVTIAQEDLSAELNGIGELVWLNGDTARGMPVGLSDQDIYSVGGNAFGMIVGIYERDDDEDAFKIETAKRPNKMTSDGDEPEIRPANHMALVNYALHKCFDRPGETRDPKQSDYFRALFDEDRKANRGQPVVRQRRTVKPWRL